MLSSTCCITPRSSHTSEQSQTCTVYNDACSTSETDCLLSINDFGSHDPSSLPRPAHPNPSLIAVFRRRHARVPMFVSEVFSRDPDTHENSDLPSFTIPVSRAMTRLKSSGGGVSSSVAQSFHVLPSSSLMATHSGVRGPQLCVW
jgi:hypothetical protein